MNVGALRPMIKVMNDKIKLAMKGLAVMCNIYQRKQKIRQTLAVL